MSTATTRAPLPGSASSEEDNKPAPKRKKRRPGRPRGTTNRMFGMEVKDAKRGLTMPFLQVDVERASAVKTKDVNDQENFLSCVIAQACTRVCGAERVAILRETAYVAFPGENITRRYGIDRKSRRVLEAWDRGEPMVEGVELRLTAPIGIKTREGQLKQSRKWRREHGHSDNYPGGRKTERRQRKPDPLHNIVRNGNLVRWS